jgi:hypothetical protein
MLGFRGSFGDRRHNLEIFQPVRVSNLCKIF